MVTMSHLDKNLFLKNYFARLEFKRDTLEDEMKLEYKSVQKWIHSDGMEWT